MASPPFPWPEIWPAPAARGPVRGLVDVPGSKSITNRALILAALADGPTRITRPLLARDTRLMAGAISALGSRVRDEASAGGDGDWLVSPGWADQSATGQPATVEVGNAGTVIRFVPPAAALARADVAFRGDPRAAQRPVGPLLAALAGLGAEIDDDGRRAVPFTVRGRGRMPGGTVTLDASGSSQLVSGLLLSAARYDQGAEIRHEGPRVPSAPLIAMTVDMLRAAGADVETSGAGPAGSVPDAWRVRPGPLAGGTIAVESDLPNAGPFLAAALVTGGQVTIGGWPAVSLQAAGQVLGTLEQMGATWTAGPDGLTLTGTGAVHGISADLRDINELAPVLVATAAVADSPSEFTGIGHMRDHETDRLAALASEIGALGGDVTELPDGLRIRPRPLRADGTVFDSHDDHRMVMAAAVLGLVVPGLRVRNAATVGKTFPSFGEQWQQMLEHGSLEHGPSEHGPLEHGSLEHGPLEHGPLEHRP